MQIALQTTLIATDQALKIVEALKSVGLDWTGADTIPFTDTIIQDLEGQDYIPYGSTTLTKIALSRGWKGLAFPVENFKCSEWNQHNGINMLNHDAHLMTVAEAAVEAALWGNPDKLWFIRPNDDLKLFAGTVMPVGEIAEWLNTASDSSKGSFKPTDEVVWVQTYPGRISAEWRCFVINGNVVSSSMYRCEGRMLLRREDNPALKYQFQRLASEWLPHVNCVMDIALSEGEFKVLEFNCINASGFYDNDIGLIFTALKRYYDNGGV